MREGEKEGKESCQVAPIYKVYLRRPLGDLGSDKPSACTL